MSELPLAAIADAGPLIHLDELGVLRLLAGFKTVLVPSIVAREATGHRPGWADRAPPSVQIRDPSTDAIERLLAMVKAAELDPGELAALALWFDNRDSVLLCDDLEARRQANRIGCEVAGTLGILLWAAADARLTRPEARELIRLIPTRTTLHIRPVLLETALQFLE